MRRADPDKRAAILRAAAAGIEERRGGALTIEAVARRAGVAKGMSGGSLARRVAPRLPQASYSMLWSKRSMPAGPCPDAA